MKTEAEIREEVRRESKVRWAIDELLWALRDDKIPDQSRYHLFSAINLLNEAINKNGEG